MGAGLSGPGLYYCPWPRCFVYHTIAFGAAFTLPCCALRGISCGATMTIEALVGFGFPILPRPGSFLCTLLGVRSEAAYIRKIECDHTRRSIHLCAYPPPQVCRYLRHAA